MEPSSNVTFEQVRNVTSVNKYPRGKPHGYLFCANTPQAKGRVERVNGTLQDRLIKEMRLRKINNIEEANQFLPEFITNYNKRFSVSPRVSCQVQKNNNYPID